MKSRLVQNMVWMVQEGFWARGESVSAEFFKMYLYMKIKSCTTRPFDFGVWCILVRKIAEIYVLSIRDGFFQACRVF